MKVVFLSLAASSGAHAHNQIAQSETCFSKVPAGVQVFWMYGNPQLAEPRLNGEILELPCEENYGNLLTKTILGLRYVSEKFNPDFVVRINTSNYFHIPRVIELLATNSDLENGPGGLIGEHEIPNLKSKNNRHYLNGAGIYMSREIYRKLLEIDVTYYDDVVDDVAIGDFFLNEGIPLVGLKRCDVTDSMPIVPTHQTRLKAWHRDLITYRRFYEMHRIYSARNVATSYFWFIYMQSYEVYRAVRMRRFKKVRALIRNIISGHRMSFTAK